MKKLFVFIAVSMFLCCTNNKQQDLPKTLLFSPISPEYLADTAVEWKQNGFDGFLLSGIMANWGDDIWAQDGDPSSRNESDATFQRIKNCNDMCRKAGITDNFIKIAFYKHVPLWTDNAAWEGIIKNFAEAARFAKLSGCKGISLDIEYVNEQYQFNWQGYDYKGYSQQDLITAANKRGYEMVNAMLKEYPDMVYLTLPESITFYGPIAKALFTGWLEAMAEQQAPGGLFVLTELSYDMVSTFGLLHYAFELESKILDAISPKAQDYWMKTCGVSLAGWPLGYYREIVDKDGEFLGWSGKKETFGDSLVGSYADKSSRFSVEDFKNQYAGILLGSKKYCWIYGHGATWWQFDQADVEKYGKVGNSVLPLDPQFDQYLNVVKEKWISTPAIQNLVELAKTRQVDAFNAELGFVSEFHIVGPFGCESCNNFDTEFPPETKTDIHAEYTVKDKALKWQQCKVDPVSGYLDFRKHFQPTEWVCAYAYISVNSTIEQDAQIRLGTNDTATLWFNGQKLFAKNIERSAAPDSDILSVRLNKGENKVLIKVCNSELNWGLYLRITRDDGSPLDNVEIY